MRVVNLGVKHCVQISSVVGSRILTPGHDMECGHCTGFAQQPQMRENGGRQDYLREQDSMKRSNVTSSNM